MRHSLLYSVIKISITQKTSVNTYNSETFMKNSETTF